MTTVFVVMRNYEYEGSELVAVFSSAEKAEACAREEEDKRFSLVSYSIHEESVL